MPPPPRPDPVVTATTLADHVLFPRAPDVDRGLAPVAGNLDELAGAGLFGLHVPVEAGGLGADPVAAGRVVEALAGGCLTTTFAWIQHQGVVKRLAATDGAVPDQWLPSLASGEARAGVAVGGVRPGRDPVVARRGPDGWLLRGVVPWVTGWGLVDVLLVAARDEDGGDVLWFLLDAPGVADPDTALTPCTDTVGLHRVTIAACDHANSAVVELRDHPAPAARLVIRQPYPEWQAADAAGLRTNGSLPLGVATRCGRLAGDDRLLDRVDAVRTELDAAGTAQLPAARARAASLAWHAAQVLLVATGGRGVGVDDHAQRLAREAMFLQVFGTRPSIRSAHLRRLGEA